MIKHKVAKMTYDDFREKGGFTQMSFKTERWLDHSLSKDEIDEIRKFTLVHMPNK